MSEKTETTGGGQRAGIDWQEIHRRLEASRVLLEQKATSAGDEKMKVLRARAKILAREPEADKGGREQIEVVEFLLAYETYAIESSFVREVYPLKYLAPLPGTPPSVSGIINVRGQIVSVINLKKFFDLPEKGLPDLNKVIILQYGKTEFGILADAVLNVRHVFLDELQPSLPTITGVRLQYLKGVTAGRLVVLDAAKLMADPKINISQTKET
jgi:purine-binding chemotaxis protein CheW